MNFAGIGVRKKASGLKLRYAALFSAAFVWLSLCVLFYSFPFPVYAEQVPVILAAEQPSADTPGAAAASAAPQHDPQSPGSIAGKIVDPTGSPLVGAAVKLSCDLPFSDPEVLTGDDGQFAFPNATPGAFRLTITATGFATQTFSGTLHPGETFLVPQMTLAVATVVAEVNVVLSRAEIAEQQLQDEEKQRVLGFIPNFYVSYVSDAAPLSPKQKFRLAWKSSVDPVTFGITGAVAGIEQAQNEYSGFGQGAQGYAKRYGAAYADTVIGTFIGSAILPSVLKQDPRYFYKGTGSKRSRLLYAMANAVICKGDNGHWQPNYSGILGGFAAGGISTLYYPSTHNEAELTVENTLIGIGSTAAANILQEFVVRKLTPNLPKHVTANP